MLAYVVINIIIATIHYTIANTVAKGVRRSCRRELSFKVFRNRPVKHANIVGASYTNV